MTILYNKFFYLTLTTFCKNLGVEYVQKNDAWGTTLIFVVPPELMMIIKFSMFGTLYQLLRYNPDEDINIAMELESGQIEDYHLRIIENLYDKYRR